MARPNIVTDRSNPPNIDEILLSGEKLSTKEEECYALAMIKARKLGGDLDGNAALTAIMSECLAVGGVEEYKHGLPSAAQRKQTDCPAK